MKPMMLRSLDPDVTHPPIEIPSGMASVAKLRVRLSRRGGFCVRAQSQTIWKEAWITKKLPVTKKGTLQGLSLRVDPSWCNGYTSSGQYVQARAVGKDSPVAYLAIASPPCLSKTMGGFELLVKPGGDAVDKILDGQGVVEVTDAMGKGFGMEKLEDQSIEEVLLFCTGTGIAPIRSLIEEAGASGLHPKLKKKVQLWYGVPTDGHLPYEERLTKDWTQDLGIDVRLVYSRQGNKEYIQQAFGRSRGIVDPTKACAVIVGQKDMSNTIKNMLVEQGLNEDRILSNF